ncbi:MAG TPA: hypothetical protein VJY85_03610 [Candidatus Limnocylindria bacterium]|nr:hypothetical protein [Candidatus Limnocylindria bacterium]
MTEGTEPEMVDMLDYRLHNALLQAEDRLAGAERRRAPNGIRIHLRPARRDGRQGR